MSTTPEALGRMRPEDYLEFEADQLHDRHELVDGWLYAMTGGTVRHERIAANLLVALGGHLAEGPCRAYKGDLKLRVGDDFYYPDLLVRCDDASVPGGATFIDDADAVIEILSPSTQRYDRGDKRAAYWRVPSLKHYVTVFQDEIRADHHRGPDGDSESLVGDDAVLRFDSLDFEVRLADLYR